LKIESSKISCHTATDQFWCENLSFSYRSFHNQYIQCIRLYSFLFVFIRLLAFIIICSFYLLRWIIKSIFRNL